MTTTRFRPGTSGNPAGRKRKTVKPNALATVTQMAARGCRERDIARACDMAPKVWARCLAEQDEVARAFAAGRQQLHDSLINKLYEKAMKGDTVSLIFACKILLGYRENDAAVEFKPQINITLPGALPLEKFAALESKARHLLANEVRRG